MAKLLIPLSSLPNPHTCSEIAMDSSNNLLVPGTPNCTPINLVNDQSTYNTSTNLCGISTGIDCNNLHAHKQYCMSHNANDLQIFLMNTRSLANKLSNFQTLLFHLIIASCASQQLGCLKIYLTTK